jgi:uroporphyrin-III C-methyltransferase
MGVARCAAIQAGLMAGGARADTPVAVVQSATRDAQRQLITTLGELPQALAASGLGSPSIIVVGDVVRCADTWGGAHDGAPGRAPSECAVAPQYATGTLN